jgi:hypothetical protein
MDPKTPPKASWKAPVPLGASFAVPQSVVHPTAAPKTNRLVFQSDVVVVDRRPRRMTNEACDATLLVTHAMDYLTDSRELPSGKVIQMDQAHPDVYALQLLLESKYQIYLGCPTIERRKSALAGLFKGKNRRKQP